MALPIVLGGSAGAGGGHDAHAGHAAARLTTGLMVPFPGLVATAAHAVGYLLVTGLIAAVVNERAGLRMLRSAWINLDLFWGVALLITGAATLVA